MTSQPQAEDPGEQAVPPVEEESPPPTPGKPLSEQPAYGFWIVMVAIAAIILAFGLALLKWDDPDDVTTTMAIVTAAVSALVAAFFGVRAGTYAVAKDVERQRAREDETRRTNPRRPVRGEDGHAQHRQPRGDRGD